MFGFENIPQKLPCKNYRLDEKFFKFLFFSREKLFILNDLKIFLHKM